MLRDRQLPVEKTNGGSVTRSGVKDSERSRALAEELLATARADG
ncbi:hypothetical protein AB0M61_41075 [Streptomyces sp. NPDC051642]